MSEQPSSEPEAETPVNETPVKDRPSRLSLPTFPAARLGSSTWLLHLRAFAVLGQLITILAAGWVTGIPLRYAPLLSLVGLTAVTNVFYAVWLRRQDRRGPSPTPTGTLEQQLSALDQDESTPVQSVALGLMLLDLATLTGMLYFSGGADNPFSFFYFVNLAVGGVMIRPRAAWSLTVVATIGYAWILFRSVPVAGITLPDPGRQMDLHTVSSLLAFATCATVVTYFVTRTSGLLRDRERQLREKELAQAADRRLEALTTLAAGAAHELATPLSTIDVIARELARHLEDVEKPVTVDQDLKLIDHQLEMCRHILQRMRGAAGDSMASQWQRTTVGDLIDATLEGVRDPHRVDVVDGTAAVENQTLWVPEEAVAQAIRNLIHNGLDASGDNDRVQVDATLADHTVQIRVTDQGQGMTDEVLTRLGDPFFTTKEPGRGIGLGLYLSRNVVSQLGGTLRFQSTPQQGTAAIVTLPLTKPDHV